MPSNEKQKSKKKKKEKKITSTRNAISGHQNKIKKKKIRTLM